MITQEGIHEGSHSPRAHKISDEQSFMSGKLEVKTVYTDNTVLASLCVACNDNSSNRSGRLTVGKAERAVTDRRESLRSGLLVFLLSADTLTARRWSGFN